jgi:hypothetical protein
MLPAVQTLSQDPALPLLWENLMARLRKEFGLQRITLEGLLLLIGLREMGWGARQLTKEEKQDLLHNGLCTVLAVSGYYQQNGFLADGWPNWELIKPLPFLDVFDQVNFLRAHLIYYFQQIYV